MSNLTDFFPAAGGGAGGGASVNQYDSFIIQDGTREGIPATAGYDPSTGIYTFEDKSFLRTGTRIAENSASFTDYPAATITNYERSIVSGISQSTNVDKFWIIGNSMYCANTGIGGDKRANSTSGILERYDYNSGTGKFDVQPATRTLVAQGVSSSNTYAAVIYPVQSLGAYHGIQWFHYNSYNDRFYIAIYSGNNYTAQGALYILSVERTNLIDNKTALIGASLAQKVDIMTSNRNAGMWDNALNGTNTSGSYDIADYVGIPSNMTDAVGEYSDKQSYEGVGDDTDNTMLFQFGSLNRKCIYKTPVPDSNGHLGTSAGITRLAYLNIFYKPVSALKNWYGTSIHYYLTVTNGDGTIDLVKRVSTFTDTTMVTLSGTVDTVAVQNLGGTSSVLTPRSWGAVSSIFGTSQTFWASQAATVNAGTFAIQAHIGDPTIREVVDTNLNPPPTSSDDDALFVTTDAMTVAGSTGGSRVITISVGNPGNINVDDTLTLTAANGNIYKGIITAISGALIITVDFTGSPNGFPVASATPADWISVSITDRLGEFNTMVPTVFLRIK